MNSRKYSKSIHKFLSEISSSTIMTVWTKEVLKHNLYENVKKSRHALGVLKSRTRHLHHPVHETVQYWNTGSWTHLCISLVRRSQGKYVTQMMDLAKSLISYPPLVRPALRVTCPWSSRPNQMLLNIKETLIPPTNTIQKIDSIPEI